MSVTRANPVNAFSYDPFSFASHVDPYPAYRILRDEYPVYHNEDYGFWALSRFDDIQRALRDWRALSSGEGVEMDGTFGPGSFIDLDPPRHDVLRRILHSEFTPKGVAQLTAKLEEMAEALVGEWSEGDQVDLAADFALRFPAAVACHLMGLPERDLPFLRGIAADIIVRDPGNPGIPPAAQEAADQLLSYLEQEMRRRRARPTNDWLGLALQAEAAGDLHKEETMSFAHLFFVAATETTAGFTATSLEHLGRDHPERRLLQSDWALLQPAIEELLRYETPVQNLSRVTTTPWSVQDSIIPAGERVVLLYASGNRDPRRFAEPDKLDLRRAPRRNLAFGEGIHHCLGAPLARLEARVALKLILTRFPDYEITGPRTPLHTHTTRAVAALPAHL